MLKSGGEEGDCPTEAHEAFCFIYRASKPRILNTAEEQVWAQEDRFWDMLLSVTPGKDVVKTIELSV